MPESEWDPEQLAWMVALAQYEADLCGGCGGLKSITTSPAHDFHEPDNALVFDRVPGTPLMCHQCAAMHRVQQETEAGKPKYPGAMQYAVQLAPRGSSPMPGGLP